MLSTKFTPEIRRRLFSPKGREKWLQHSLALGIRNTILKEIDGKDEVHITETDAHMIAKTAETLRCGDPNFNPFSGGRAALLGGTYMIQTPESIRQALT